MGASVFVGRVGGLAVALGVGAAVFSSAYGVAWADSGTQTDSGTASASKPANTGRAKAPTARKVAPKPAAAARKARIAAAAAAPAADAPVADATPATDSTPAVDATPVADATPDVVAPEVVAYSAAPDAVGSGPTRRGANATASSGLTAAPAYTYFDGVLQGNMNVTSSSGCGSIGSTCKITYEFVESSAGGKLNLGNVPVALAADLPANLQGGAGSFTFLPYATWIDPANPDRNATPTSESNGNQSFTVQIRENTKFDQTMSNIPLFGSSNQRWINRFQDWGLFSGLIGSALLSTVNVETNLTVLGRQVAYTYTVSSFDGTPISMNYFPASAYSLVLPGEQQATIFNGPGLGSPGETNPYGIYQAAGSVPGLSVMRGQGLPAPFDQAPIGFNVVTWDPRGEFASGGVLQLDNPFYEGRDVSALIDWANANTPLLNENADGELVSPCSPGDDGCSPDVAMMGGSYGGGIQMTTVDPRIKSIVPSIAWNSLNEALYPNNVFKTGWANTLAAFLLLVPNSTTGTTASSVSRVNSQITQALITGNLFGFISDSAQAVLSSSGPTSLLTKLSIPTFYDQGTIDALFPLQQAIENARTQLDQNPFFAGDNAQLVRMLWFCGGHGVCTTQTVEQQTRQNTVMFLENLIWVNKYTKGYLGEVPIDPPVPTPIGPVDTVGDLLELLLGFGVAPFQWWDQAGTALASFDNPVVCAFGGFNCGGMPWTSDFQDTPPIVAGNVTGGRINSFTSRTGPLTASDAAGAVCTSVAQACEFPLNQVFATEADNAVNVDIAVPYELGPTVPGVVVGAPLVSFAYSGRGNAKAVYAQIVDNATGQVLGNINTAIPVILDGTDRTVVDFPIANIAYTAPEGGGSLTLQIVAKSSLYKNNDVIWSIDLTNVGVSLPTTNTAVPNPILTFLPI